MSQGQIYSPPDFTPADVKNLINGLDEFLKQTSDSFIKYNNEPADDSIAINERVTFPKEVSVKNAHYGGFMSMEAAADHLIVFGRFHR